jgi:hypothetical protein
MNFWELDSYVCDIFDSASTLELNPVVLTLTPGTPCILPLFGACNTYYLSIKHFILNTTLPCTISVNVVLIFLYFTSTT